jgi:hypothetical protein
MPFGLAECVEESEKEDIERRREGGGGSHYRVVQKSVANHIIVVGCGFLLSVSPITLFLRVDYSPFYSLYRSNEL